MRSLLRLAVALVAVAMLSNAAAADLKVLSTIALRDAWHDLQPKFEARGHKLDITLATSGALAKQIADGATGDVLVSTTAGVDALAKQGKVVAGSETPFARSATGVAIRKGAPRPDISTPEAFRQTLLSAKAVAYSDPAGGGASGALFVKILERLGVAEQVNAKAKLGRGIPNAEFVARGEADIAIQQIPELMPVAGVEVIGPLPGDLNSITAFSAGTLSGSRQPAAAKALLEFLKSPETAAYLKSKGFE
jgi:molybdate transport system substrate-binding protein